MNMKRQFGMTMRAMLLSMAAVAVLHAGAARGEPVDPPVSKPHPVVRDEARFETNREGLGLDLPAEEDSFVFAIFGDRTGGPASGVRILADAVRDVNLLEPDLVMTVGDLVQGYNAQDQWIQQMGEFKGIMDELLMPWFPVAGNHDMYWRGPDRPAKEHEANFETHFGPLWYAFKHKKCWFIVLFSDETDPATGQKSFNKPAGQTMSAAQFAWLQETLKKTAGADHVFLFLHHPRWLGGGYGNDWEKVHAELVAAGNVTAVFAGHIHKMIYARPRDGIEYMTLATVGGAQSGVVPEAGYLHHYNLVTVRKDQIAIAAVPVGEVMNVRAITTAVSNEANRLSRLRPRFPERVTLQYDGSAEGSLRATVENPADRPIEVTLIPESDDSRWSFGPNQVRRVIPAGESAEFAFRAARVGDSLDRSYRNAILRVQMDYLAEGVRVGIPESQIVIPLHRDLAAPERPAEEFVLSIDGRDDCLTVPHRDLPLPDGPLTLECWFNAKSFGERTGLLCKTESSEYGFFVSNGAPVFSLFLDNRYVEVRAANMTLEPDVWHHIAGVYDGIETRLYVDGELVARVTRSGKRRINRLPLVIGADVDQRGRLVSHFNGMIDGVRLSKIARYASGRFEPTRRHEPDDDTILLLNMDGMVGPWLFDESPAAAHATIVGEPVIGPAR